MYALKVTTPTDTITHPHCHALINDGDILLVIETATKKCVAAYAKGEWKRFTTIDVDDRKSQR